MEHVDLMALTQLALGLLLLVACTWLLVLRRQP